MIRKQNFLVVALVGIATLTGCSLMGIGAQDGTESSIMQQPPGETKPQLDTGRYATSPMNIAEATDPTMARSVESFILAEYLPLSYEVDSALTDTKGAFNILEPENLNLHLTRKQVDILKQDPPLYGFLSSAAAPKGQSAVPQAAINHAVLRFHDPETARRVAQAEHDLLVTTGVSLIEGDQATPDEAIHIDGMPESFISTGQQDARQTVDVASYTPYQEYVIYTWAQAPVDNAD